jgi:hypothetical protein
MRTEPDNSYVPEKETERAEFLAWSARLGPITAEALAQRNDLSNAKARERLDEAVRLGLMEKHSVLVGYSDLYTVTVDGRRLARKQAQAGGYVYLPRMRTAHVNNREVRHTIACGGGSRVSSSGVRAMNGARTPRTWWRGRPPRMGSLSRCRWRWRSS